jgi:hypothetical protein
MTASRMAWLSHAPGLTGGLDIGVTPWFIQPSSRALVFNRKEEMELHSMEYGSHAQIITVGS